MVKTWYLDGDEDGEETVVYGIIKRIFTHSLYPGGANEVFAECEWLETIPPGEQGEDVYLPQVRHSPNNNLNRRARPVLLRSCAAYNIMLAPHKPWDALGDANTTVYDVIDRWRKYADNSV